MPTIVVDVMPKAELLDPQGKAVSGALGRLGNTDFSDVRIGKRFELTVDGEVTDEVLASARKVADEILSNSVIEDVVGIEVVEGPPASGSSPSPVPSTTSTRDARSPSPAQSPSHCGTARTISTVSMHSSCPGASATAIICAPEPSPPSRRSWPR